MSAWREYQKQAASFFTKLGFTARVEYEIAGVRGKHKVDVYIEGNVFGIPIKWAVECKAWKTNVPKEKVMAFSAIIQDTGIERGFLLSEKGFQSRAIQAARKMNIQLTSISDLEAVTKDSIQDSRLGAMNWRIQKARERLRKIKNDIFDGEPIPMAKELGSLLILEHTIQEISTGTFPIRYSSDQQFDDFESFYEFAVKTVARAESWEPSLAWIEFAERLRQQEQ